MRGYLAIFLCFISPLVRSNPFPINIVNGLMVSEAVIEGKKVLVIFDTGAPGLVLNNRFYATENPMSIQCAGINGNFQCHLHEIKEWSWMGIIHTNTNALVSDLSFLENALHQEVYALIGLSVLNDYYVSIDYDRKLISLSEKMDVDKDKVMKFRYVNHLPVIKCKVNGVKKTLGLDTGSEINYLFADDSKNAQLHADASPVLVIGTDNHKDIKYQLNMDLELDANLIYPSTFIIDLQGKESFVSKSFDGLLGQPFLSQFNITIHPSKQIIILTPRKSVSNQPEELTVSTN